MTIKSVIKFLILLYLFEKNASGSTLGIGINAIRNKRILILEEQHGGFSNQELPGRFDAFERMT